MGRKPATAESERPQYGVDQATFVIVWQTSNSVDEVMQKLEDFAKKNKVPAMPKAIVLARAHNYRVAGINIKKMKRDNGRGLKKDELNTLIEKLEKGEVIPDFKGNSPSFAPPPDSKINPASKKILEELAAKFGR